MTDCDWIRIMSRFDPFWVTPRNVTFQTLNDQFEVVKTDHIATLTMNEIICDSCNQPIQRDEIPCYCYREDGREYLHDCYCADCVTKNFADKPQERDQFYLDIHRQWFQQIPYAITQRIITDSFAKHLLDIYPEIPDFVIKNSHYWQECPLLITNLMIPWYVIKIAVSFYRTLTTRDQREIFNALLLHEKIIQFATKF